MLTKAVEAGVKLTSEDLTYKRPGCGISPLYWDSILGRITARSLPADHPLWGYDNVAITPHCAAVYDGWDIRSVRMFADNLARYRKGKALQNVVNPERGY